MYVSSTGGCAGRGASILMGEVAELMDGIWWELFPVVFGLGLFVAWLIDRRKNNGTDNSD